MKRMILIYWLLVVCVAAGYAQPVVQSGLPLQYLEQLPAVASAHPPVIILLHGYGSDERDLFELRKFFPPQYLLLSARAPFALPGGGYQWYGINAAEQERGQQIKESSKIVSRFVTAVVAKYHADGHQVYILGFSQGAVMCYAVALRCGGVKGIAALSGKIYPEMKADAKLSSGLKQMRIFIAHGSQDNRISFADGEAANNYLSSLGLSPAFHRYDGMGHAISNSVMDDVVQWLK